MMKLTVVALLGAVSSSAAAAAAADPRVPVETHFGVPHVWSRAAPARPDPSTRVRLTVAVKHDAAGAAALERELLRRSDPENADFYGRWLTAAQVDALVAPSPDAVRAVRRWLEDAGATEVAATGTGDWVSATLTVADVEERLLGGRDGEAARYHHYTHGDNTDDDGDSGDALRILRLNATYTLPAEVAAHVDFIGPSVRFPVVQRRRLPAPQGKGRRRLFGPSGDSVDPEFLRNLYNASDAVASPSTKNIQACSSFLGQFYSPSDLEKFFGKYAQDAKVTTPTVHGPNTASNPGVEAELDIQYIMGVGRDIPTQFWSTAGQQPHNPENEPFLVWLQNVANTTDADMPLTMSVSYGDNEPGVDNGYANRVGVEFQKAGVRGTSIMFSSGDGGVSGGQSQPCDTFVPTFPAGSPWVTAVGGTTKTKPEVCASFSSGGFSNYFGRPSYQDAAVQGYLNSGTAGMPSSSLYNASGAGIPDVSAQGENFEVIQNGFAMPVDGTSCSSPAFTAIIGLVNEARLAAGKSSLGYLNPWIYKTAGPAGAFNDVTKGSNPGCRTQGFPAAKGWDPVTGWGTPNFGLLKDLALQLP